MGLNMELLEQLAKKILSLAHKRDIAYMYERTKTHEIIVRKLPVHKYLRSFK